MFDSTLNSPHQQKEQKEVKSKFVTKFVGVVAIVFM